MTRDLQTAQVLWQHWQAGTTVEALPAFLRPATRAEGYAAQARLPEVSGCAAVGWKIAATSVAGQHHIGVSGPLAGRILSGKVHPSDAELSLHGNRMRVAEPEFAFRFGRTLPPRRAPYTVSEVLAAVDALLPALELPDSRFSDFARAGEAQLLADAACAFRFVLGAPVGAGWRDLDLRAHRVHAQVFRDGGSAHLERTGDGSAVLGDPFVALQWLANEVSSLGLALEAGQFVSTGTCMSPLAVAPGDRVTADFGVLGRVGVHLCD